MNCAFDKEKLTGYYDGELDAAEKAEVERHIASCSECLRELGELKSAAVLVKELPRLRAPRSIAEGVSRELQAAGRVHSFARFRRNLLWAASAAAGLLVVLNVVYFAGKAEKSPEMSAAPAMGRATPLPEAAGKRQQDAAKDAAPAREVPAEEQSKERGRKIEARKNAFGGEEGKKAELPAPPPAPDPSARDREKTVGANATKVEEKTRAAAEQVPAPVPAKPAAPPAPKPDAPGAPAPSTAKAAAEAPADKVSLRRDGDGLQAGKSDESKLKRPSEPLAEAGPTHLTLASTQAAKSRTQLEDALRKLGALPPPPPAAMMKGASRSATVQDAVYQVELTDVQMARLRAELEKPGTSVIVAGRPEDPVMAAYRRGGVFEPKKESAVASGGASAVKKGFDAKQPEGKTDPKEKDAKESDDNHAAKALTGEAERTNAPRRKFVLHLMEVPALQTQPAGDPVKK